MPFLLPNIIGGAGVKAEYDLEGSAPGMDAKAVPQPRVEREFSRPFEAPARGRDRLDPGGHKRADVLTQMVVGEEEPLAVDIGQVVRINHSPFRFLHAGLAVSHFQLLS